jgi:hypothetical protein
MRNQLFTIEHASTPLLMHVLHSMRLLCLLPLLLFPSKTIETGSPPPEVPKETIVKDIQAVVRQITASVTFLPLLEDPCEHEAAGNSSSSSSIHC